MLPVIPDTSLRAGIVQDLVETLIAIEFINGAIDDLPFDMKHPPRPRPGHGSAAHPFSYVADIGETANFDSLTNRVSCVLDIQLDTTFEYSTTDGAQGLMPRGRALGSQIQAAVMRDPNRGMQTLTNGDRVKRASRTTESAPPTVSEAIGVGEGLGVVSQRFAVEYLREPADPGAR